MISARTTVALAGKKRKGVLGNRTNLAEAGTKGVATNKKAAGDRDANVLPIIRQIQTAGATTLRAIAEALNSRGMPAPRGGDWQPSTVRNLLARHTTLR
jgi:Recombinase